MNQCENGILLRAGKNAPSRGALPPGLFTAPLLYGAVWGTALSMLGMGEYGLAPFFGAAVIIAVRLFGRTRRARLSALAALLLAAAIYCALRADAVADGLRLIANRMFEQSAARQVYEYDMFPVSAAGGLFSTCLRAAFILLAVLTATPFAIAPAKLLGAFSVCAFVLDACASAYFGVTPAIGWTLAIPAAMGLILIIEGEDRAGPVRGAAALFLLAVIAGAVLLLAPGQNARVSALESQMRDALAFHTVGYTDSLPQETENLNDPNAGPSAPRAAQENLPGESVLGWPEIPPVVLLIALTLIILFVPAIFIDRYRRRVERNRAGLEDGNAAVAIRAMFPYAMRWLFAAGVQPMNASCLAYRTQLRALMPEGYADVYTQAACLWQEAAFSDHEMTPEQRDRMRAYLSRTRELVWLQADWKARLRIKYRLAL